MFEVLSGVPIPPHHRGKYPFKNMAVGDSFMVPFSDPHGPKATSTIRSLRALGIRHWGKQSTLVLRVEGGIRVWRVK